MVAGYRYGSDDGSPCIYVYANKLRPARAIIPNIWCDVPVKLKKLGNLSPAYGMTVQRTVQENAARSFVRFIKKIRSKHVDRITGEGRQAQREILHAP